MIHGKYYLGKRGRGDIRETRGRGDIRETRGRGDIRETRGHGENEELPILHKKEVITSEKIENK
jgi:hypothetical protein